MALQLRSSSNQVRGHRFASTGATTAKVPHLFNSKVWIPMNTELANASNEFVFESLVSGAAKATGEAWTPGGNIYWDNTNSRFTTTASGNTLCGKAVEAAAAGDTVTPLFLFNTFAA
jgi:predicted RecA/RadA family phage recombinase